MEANGAWLELQWKRAQRASHVQLCFDSGLERKLTLSEHHGVRKRQIRGPQAETVRDYRLLFRTRRNGHWREIVAVTGNYQRLRHHLFSPVSAQALRLEITATNSVPEARVYEMRCYGQS